MNLSKLSKLSNLLLSWRLWRATFHNSLYNFPLLLASPDGKHSPERSDAGADGGDLRAKLFIRRLSSVMLGIVMVYLLIVQPGFISLILFIVFIMLVLFAGTVSAWLATQRIAGAIFREQEKGRYEMLLLTPPGVLGVHWAIVTRLLRDDRLLRWLRWLPSGFYIFVAFPLIGLLVALVLTSFLWLFSENNTLGVTAFFQASTGLVLIVMCYSDYVQSVMIGILVGILLPTYARRQAENAAYAVASAAFFSMQMCFYLVYGMGGLALIMEVVRPALREARYAIVLGVVIASLVFMVLLREVVVRWLWRMAEQRLYFDSNDSGIRV